MKTVLADSRADSKHPPIVTSICRRPGCDEDATIMCGLCGELVFCCKECGGQGKMVEKRTDL